jgi:hypothetical protein
MIIDRSMLIRGFGIPGARVGSSLAIFSYHEALDFIILADQDFRRIAVIASNAFETIFPAPPPINPNLPDTG